MEGGGEPGEGGCKDNLVYQAIKNQGHAERSPVIRGIAGCGFGYPDQQLVWCGHLLLLSGQGEFTETLVKQLATCINVGSVGRVGDTVQTWGRVAAASDGLLEVEDSGKAKGVS